MKVDVQESKISTFDQFPDNSIVKHVSSENLYLIIQYLGGSNYNVYGLTSQRYLENVHMSQPLYVSFDGKVILSNNII